jgi:DNA recombination protein RmuC
VTLADFLPGLVVAGIATLAIVIAVILIRREGKRAAGRISEAQSESMRWLSAQLAQSVDTIQSRLGEVSQQVTAGQAVSGEAMQRRLSQELKTVTDSMNTQLRESHRVLGQSLTGATEVFGKVQGGLGRMRELAARLEQLAQGVEEIGRILRVPKLRGLMGEQALETLLDQVLPRALWEAQYRFPDGRAVDVVIRLGDRLLPIDAKFPLEAFRRLADATNEEDEKTARKELGKAIKVRIDEIAGRYIRPGEGTLDFALMFVPAEAVFAHVLSEEHFDYGFSKRVLPVSPATLFAFLSLIAAGARGLEVDARSREVVREIEGAEIEAAKLREDVTVLGRHLHNTSQRFSVVEAKAASLHMRLEALGRVSSERETSPQSEPAPLADD